MREIRTSGATRGAGELQLLPPTLPVSFSFPEKKLSGVGRMGGAFSALDNSRWLG